MLEAGVAFPGVARIMGWSAATTVRMAKRYGHIGQGALRDALEVLGRSRIAKGSLKKSPKSPEVKGVVLQ
jgi:hypothetical protein